jgi:glycerol uptake facilitator-like aquaporin
MNKNKYLAEFIGTGLLLAVVVGSGIMGTKLSANNAVALLANSIATGAGLFVLIALLMPISGAHLNPAISLVDWANKRLTTGELVKYIVCQILGAIAGVFLAHLIFDLSILQVSTNPRSGINYYISEFISTLILLSVIYFGNKNSIKQIPILVALTVMAGYWFTSSTFFVNPAVTIARNLTNTFTGIQRADVIPFVVAQLMATFIFIIITRSKRKK